MNSECLTQKRIHCLILAILCLPIFNSFSGQTFPKSSWTDSPDPIASPHAFPGGSISTFAGQYPNSFNYYLANNTFCAELFSMMYESLLEMDPVTADYTPGIAERWTISDDKKTITFHLDKRAQWSDGHSITAQDVKWTFDAILNPENMTGPHKVSLERFSEPVIKDKHTIIFTAKEVHWKNLGAAGGFHVLPKHVFEEKDFNKINFEFPVVSGPYRLGDTEESVSTKLIRRDNWWHRADRRYKNTGNYETIKFRFFAERENAFEAFRKGMIDIFPIYTSRLWVKETQSNKFAMNWIVKQKIQNYNPVGFQGFAMNMRRPPFDDLSVRKAMSHLLNREMMNKTLMYSQYFMHHSYFEDLYTKENPCTNFYYNFDKRKAGKLLASAGWIPNPETGLLEKDGKQLIVNFLTRSATADKFLKIYNEDLRDVGIKLKIERKDWASWVKDMEKFNFDMTWASWGASIFKDPESMWHSSEAKRENGNNITGFKDKTVDVLIEEQKSIFDVKKRHAICRKIDGIIARQCPYALLWNINYTRLLYWNKFGTPPTVLSKYGNASSAHSYWWYDPDSDADLTDAMEIGIPLAAPKSSVIFDNAFKGRGQ